MENPFNLKGENHEIFFDNVGNLQKKSPLDLPLGNKTYGQLTTPARTSCWVI